MKQPQISHSTWLLALGSLCLVFLFAISFVDFEWTQIIIQNRWKHFAEVMRRNVFEDGSFGGSDPVVFLLLGAIFLYFASSRPRFRERFEAFQPAYGFILSTALLGMGAVHSAKWSIGRARPHGVIKDGLGYSNWYELGSHYVADGIFFGSFPSGHTAMATLLLTVAYLLIGDPVLSRKWKIMGWIWGTLSVGYSVLMLVGRSMAKAHWVSDGLASLFLMWALMHILYFWVLRVPEQRSHYARYGQFPPAPRYWELRLCGFLLLVSLGGAMLLIGLNAFQRQEMPYLAALLLPGLALITFGFIRAQKLHRSLGHFLP